MRIPVRDDVLAAIVVLSAVVVLALISRSGRADLLRAPQIARCTRDIVDQAHAFADMAAQDDDELTKLQHLTQAVAYYTAARFISRDDEIARTSNVDVHAKMRDLETARRRLVTRLSTRSAVPIVAEAPGKKKRTARGVALF